MWLLTIEDDEGLTAFHRLTRDRYTIGRAPGCDLVLAQLDVSRQHARLERGEGGFHLVDEAGRETTLLNAMPLRGRALVGDGDVAQIAGYLLRFSASVPTGLPTPPPRYVAPARLRALAGPPAGDELVFPRDETVTIGTSDDCTLRVLNRRVSVVHALFLPLPGGRHEIVDKSHNGLLFVNERPVPGRQVLEGGDTINVGHAAIFRYLEPSQRPHPRFDAVWAEGALALATPPAAASAPGLQADLPSAPVVVDAGAPTIRAEGEAANASRVESAGPLALPAPAPPSASFERLCRATMGRTNVAGAERAVVAPPPSSGRSLVAFEAPVGEAAPALRGGASDLDDHREAKAGGSDHDQGVDDASPQGAVARERPRRAWSALLVAAAAAVVAVGATVGLQAPRGRGASARPSMGAEDDRSAGAATATLALAPPAVAVAAPEPVVSLTGALPKAAASAGTTGATSETGVAGETGATSATGAASETGATTEARANEGATAPRGSRRARLLARARSSRASASELRDLFSLCSEAGDAGCMAEARTFLLRTPRRP